ncbi:MAG: response regulator [Magnetococcales bacterium]|nr:response regulator [Magnetococcales bacterium]
MALKMELKITILVIDSDIDTLRCYETNLVRIGYVVVQANNCTDAMALFDAHRPHLAIIEARMSDPDGFTTCAALRQRAHETELPILMVTDDDDNNSVEKAFAAGADDLITKPVHWTILRQRMRHLLRGESAYRVFMESHDEGRCLEEPPRLPLEVDRLSPTRWIENWADPALYFRPRIFNSVFLNL